MKEYLQQLLYIQMTYTGICQQTEITLVRAETINLEEFVQRLDSPDFIVWQSYKTFVDIFSICLILTFLSDTLICIYELPQWRVTLFL